MTSSSEPLGIAGEALRHLETGTLRHFRDWPHQDLRISAPGVYTVWRENEFLYVGISWQDRPGSAGLYGRLNSHASGRRSGDQFCLYICDRFCIPTLTSDQLRKIGTGELSLDRMTKSFIREQLTYRAIHTETGGEARIIEAQVRSLGLPSGRRPFLNPTG